MSFVITIICLWFGYSCAGQKMSVDDSLPDIPKRFLELTKGYGANCIVKGNQSKKQLALTFDDGPTELSRQIVEVLNKYDAKATFFWQGNNLQGNEQFALETSRNHQIASHSWDHQNGWESAPEQMYLEQVTRTADEFERIGLLYPRYYRPPYGAISNDQLAFLADKNIKTVLWSLTTLDWDTTQNSAHEIYMRFESNLHAGAIVLMHDQAFNDEGQNLLIALEKILQYGLKEGYEFVTIDELSTFQN